MIIESVERLKVVVRVENREEAKDIAFRERIDTTSDRYISLITLEDPVVEVPCDRSSEQGGGGFERVVIKSAYLDPYWKVLKERTGADPFEVDLTLALGQIDPTRFLEKAAFTPDDGFECQIVCMGYANHWDKLDDTMRMHKATSNAHRCIAHALGRAILTPEFIPVGDGGLYKHNPNYPGNGTKYDPGAENEKVWEAIWLEWEKRFATPEQSALLKIRSTYANCKDKVPTLKDYSGFHISNYTSHVKWESFATLGKDSAQ